jgi:hypothetical protein
LAKIHLTSTATTKSASAASTRPTTPPATAPRVSVRVGATVASAPRAGAPARQPTRIATSTANTVPTLTISAIRSRPWKVATIPTSERCTVAAPPIRPAKAARRIPPSITCSPCDPGCRMVGR